MAADPLECNNIFEGNNLYKQFICAEEVLTPRMINADTDRNSVNGS